MRLSPEILLSAYRLGYFPMAESTDADEVFWLKPEWRGIFPLDRFHVPKSLRKVLKQERFEIRLDTAFGEVMRLCASEKAGRDTSWINDEILEAYQGLFDLGHAHSVECWRSGELVGGLYGVSISSAFFGESMFSLETDASKVALCHLVGRIKLAGYALLDTQFMTPHLMRFGGTELPDHKYDELLDEALTREATLSGYRHQISGISILQAITQTS